VDPGFATGASIDEIRAGGYRLNPRAHWKCMQVMARPSNSMIRPIETKRCANRHRRAQASALRAHRRQQHPPPRRRRSDLRTHRRLGKARAGHPDHQGWITGTACFRLRPGPTIDPRYLQHYLGRPVRDWTSRRATISSAMPTAGRRRTTPTTPTTSYTPLPQQRHADGRRWRRGPRVAATSQQSTVDRASRRPDCMQQRMASRPPHLVAATLTDGCGLCATGHCVALTMPGALAGLLARYASMFARPQPE
jgi:hypothetical protein